MWGVIMHKKNILLLIMGMFLLLLIIIVIGKNNDNNGNITSIVNDEEIDYSVLKEDVVSNKKLVFSIYSARVNCYTISLYVYDDNTYQFGNVWGKYSYDVLKILNNIDKYDENDHGPFILTDSNNKEFWLYDNNIELIDFLESIDVSLDTCMHVQ